MAIRRETGPPIFGEILGGDYEGVKLAESCCIDDYN